MEKHVVYSIIRNPRPEREPSPARIRAAVARMIRHHARACDGLAAVFGECVQNALEGRLSALRDCPAHDVGASAERLHGLLVWLAAVAEAIEAEARVAADLRADLAVMISECEMVAAVSGNGQRRLAA